MKTPEPQELNVYPLEPEADVEEPKTKRLKKYSFPDVEGERPTVVIEASSIEEAIELFQKGNA